PIDQNIEHDRAGRAEYEAVIRRPRIAPRGPRWRFPRRFNLGDAPALTIDEKRDRPANRQRFFLPVHVQEPGEVAVDESRIDMAGANLRMFGEHLEKRRVDPRAGDDKIA